MFFFNPFLANVPISYSLKTPKNLWFSGIFRGNKMGTLARNRIKNYLRFLAVFLFKKDTRSDSYVVKCEVLVNRCQTKLAGANIEECRTCDATIKRYYQLENKHCLSQNTFMEYQNLIVVYHLSSLKKIPCLGTIFSI